MDEEACDSKGRAVWNAENKSRKRVSKTKEGLYLNVQRRIKTNVINQKKKKKGRELGSSVHL